MSMSDCQKCLLEASDALRDLATFAKALSLIDVPDGALTVTVGLDAHLINSAKKAVAYYILE